MEDERELQEYVTGVLCDAGDKAVKNFTRDFLQRRRDALTGPEVRFCNGHCQSEG